MKRIGIVGGGQLGRMLAQSAQALGFTVVTLDAGTDGPAAQVSDEHIDAPFTDAAAIQRLAEMVDVITFEIESAHAGALEAIAATRPEAVHPAPRTLSIIRDKYAQKEYLRTRGIPVARAYCVESPEAVRVVAAEFGYPLVLKSRFGAYDGRGNALIKTEEDITASFEKLGGSGLYVEEYVPFEKELAVVAARSTTGECALYPVVETVHENHICHTVTMPAPVSETVRAEAQRVAFEVLSALNGAGVFGIELFMCADDTILVNEIAPRVHNSGHITMDASGTSQFEQHIRAITGMPLGDTALNTPVAVMINILGQRRGPAHPEGIDAAEALGDVHVHLYGKKETKPARKMGHINVKGKSHAEAHEKAKKARAHVTI
jgi:5-(carboxyamino)imidazole ribonucleotide synthase